MDKKWVFINSIINAYFRACGEEKDIKDKLINSDIITVKSSENPQKSSENSYFLGKVLKRHAANIDFYMM